MAFQITPDYLTTAASDCDICAGDIDANLATVRNYVVSLRDEWQGVAAVNFDGVMHDFDTFGTMLHNALINIGSGLRGTFNNYVEAEDYANTNLVKIGDEIPGAYL